MEQTYIALEKARIADLPPTNHLPDPQPPRSNIPTPNTQSAQQHTTPRKNDQTPIPHDAIAIPLNPSRQQTRTDGSRQHVPAALTKRQDAKRSQRGRRLLAHRRAHPRPHRRKAVGEEAEQEREDDQRREVVREAPGREARERGPEGREQDQGVQAHLVGEYAEGPLAGHLRGAHDGEQHGAVPRAEPDRRGVRGQEERGEEEPEALGEVGEAVHQE